MIILALTRIGDRVGDLPEKKCGHEVGYKCCCSVNEWNEANEDHEPELVEEFIQVEKEYGVSKR